MEKVSKEEISRTALNLKFGYLSLMFAANLATFPQRPLLAAWRSIWPHIPDPYIGLPDRDGNEERFRVEDVLAEVSSWGYEQMNRHVVDAAQTSTAVSIGDLVVHGGHYSKDDPLHHFVKHYRNGCAHGNRWRIDPGRLDKPAHFMDIQLDYSLNGRSTTETVPPVRHVQLLQAVSDAFGPPAPQDYANTWKHYPDQQPRNPSAAGASAADPGGDPLPPDPPSPGAA
ncbi:hypothetical protein ACI78T_13185 [Blastococcus sp. SYSU D00922]